MTKLRSNQIFRSDKCVTISELMKIAKRKRLRREQMVFTNGCFDILHVGHVCYLESARKLGDYLVVALNSDRSVKKLKGKNRPINDERSRARVLAGFAAVNYVVVFGTKRVTPLLHRLQPEIYVKGGDYTEKTLDPAERQAIQSVRGKIRILPIWKGYSTTSIIKKMRA